MEVAPLLRPPHTQRDRLVSVLAVLWLLTTAVLYLSTPVLAADQSKVESEHYMFTTTGSQAEAEEWSRMLEAAWPQYVEHFGSAPKLGKGERLTVRLFETRQEMNAAIAAAGGSPSESGGYYCPIARTAYAYRQPSVWYTRTLLLHEAAHQFHHFTTTKHTSPASWYGEGVVEHLSHHTWDGTTLRTSIIPLLSLEKRPAHALAAAESADYRFDELFAAGRDVSRAESMHLVRYLLTGPDDKQTKKFGTLARKLDRGRVIDAKSFRKQFGSHEAFLAGYRAWLATVQEPWESLWVEWDARGPDALRGTAEAIGLCRRKAATTKLEATFKVASDGPWRAGILLHWNGPTDFSIGVVNGGKEGTSGQVHRRVGTSWKRTKEGPLPAPAREDGNWTIAAERTAEGVTLTVNGKPFGTFDLPAGSMGLAVDHATVDFTGIRGK